MTTARTRLRDYAMDHHGLITTHQAHQLDIPGVEMAKLASRGALTHVAYGLYRVNDAPIMDPDAAQYAEAVLRVGEDAFLTHTAVLAFHDLALINPPAITVGTFQRVRATVPEWIDIVKRNDITETDIITYNAIRMTTVAQALSDCIPIVMIDRLDAATRDAYREGLVLRRDRDRVLELIESRDLHAVTI